MILTSCCDPRPWRVLNITNTLSLKVAFENDITLRLEKNIYYNNVSFGLLNNWNVKDKINRKFHKGSLLNVLNSLQCSFCNYCALLCVLIPCTHLVQLYHNYSVDIVVNSSCWLCLHFLHKVQVYCYYSFGPPVAFLFLILLLHFTDFTYHLLGFDFWCSFHAWIAFKTCNKLAKNEAFLPQNPLSRTLSTFYTISNWIF